MSLRIHSGCLGSGLRARHAAAAEAADAVVLESALEAANVEAAIVRSRPQLVAPEWF